MPKSKSKLIVIISIGIVIAILVLLATEILRGPRSMLAGFDRQAQRNYELVTTGQSKEEVIQLLGQPAQSSKEFCLPQRRGFEMLFDKAEKSDAVEYLLWVNGMNWFYCIGFNSSGQMLIKGEGHS